MTRLLLLLLGILSPVASAQGVADAIAATPDWSDPLLRKKRDYTGSFTLMFENDTFASESDNNFTAGFGFVWTSAPVDTLAPNHIFRTLVEEYWSFLPTLSDPDYRKFVQFDLFMEMYTASDIAEPVPAPGEHPYAGVLAFDFGVYSSDGVRFNAYIVRIGMVGPATGAGRVQNWMHRLTDRPKVEGWDDQLKNEPLLNLFYIHQRRVLRWMAGERGFGIDAAVNGGAGLGNYYIGANLGAQVRIGVALPDNFARSNPLSFVEEMVDFPPQRKRLVAYLYAQVIAVALGRFLPTDGNTFQESPSGIRDDFDLGAFLGVTVAYDRFVAQFQLTFLGTGPLAQADDYAVVTIAWIF